MPERSLQILMLCDIRTDSANTIFDYVESFLRYSRHDFRLYNPVQRDLPEWLDLEHFDVILIHWTIYLLGDNYLNPTWRKAIAESRVHKGLFIQDEYRTINALCRRKRELGIHWLFTCWPEHSIDKLYTEARLPGVKKFHVLTGYVPERYEQREPDFDAPREIDVGYRGRGEGDLFWLGELFQDKVRIGRQFKQHAERFPDLVVDISAREEDRIYGEDWNRFLRNSRCTLGTESGASVIDFTGEIEAQVKQYCAENPSASFAEVSSRFFHDAEGRYTMNQVSPRVFEAIGCGSCLVQFEGHYSGVVEQDTHFIPLKKDFSNFDEVVARIMDRDGVIAMARRAYRDIIASGDWSYRRFVARIDEVIDEHAVGEPAMPTVREPFDPPAPPPEPPEPPVVTRSSRVRAFVNSWLIWLVNPAVAIRNRRQRRIQAQPAPVPVPPFETAPFLVEQEARVKALFAAPPGDTD